MVLTVSPLYQTLTTPLFGFPAMTPPLLLLTGFRMVAFGLLLAAAEAIEGFFGVTFAGIAAAFDDEGGDLP